MPDRLTRLLGIDYPILQGGMTWVSRHGLAAAVSSSGALGVIGSGGMDPQELRGEIRALRSITSRAFAVNLPLINVRPDGVDAIVAEGSEAGGHIQSDGLSTFVLVPQVVDAVAIPVIAAGGIADARGLAAMLVLGAAGASRQRAQPGGLSLG